MKTSARNISACAALVVVLFLSGCASRQPKLVSADAVPAYGFDTLYHTVYIGSDDLYHYFGWNRGLRSGQVKVERQQIKLSEEFPRGANRPLPFVHRTPDGRIDVSLPGQAR